MLDKTFFHSNCVRLFLKLISSVNALCINNVQRQKVCQNRVPLEYEFIPSLMQNTAGYFAVYMRSDCFYDGMYEDCKLNNSTYS